MRLFGLFADPLLALVPVIAFLLGLAYLDSFKIVGSRYILVLLPAGCGAALIAFRLHPLLMDALTWEFPTYTRYGSPILEECLKAIPLICLLRRHRIGFLIDGAVYGFAVGTGFALLENVYYLQAHPQAGTMVSMIRGFGTALLHGGTGTVFAVVARVLSDLRPARSTLAILVGWLAAASIHSVYNHFFLSPPASALVVSLTLPLLVGAVLLVSERLLRQWMTQGFDADADRLALFNSREFPDSRMGRYLERLRCRLPAMIVADMLCYLRLHTELSLRAKGILMMREQGFEPPQDQEVRAKLTELEYLSRTIGKTGLRLLIPLLGKAPRDLWQLSLVSAHSGKTKAGAIRRKED